MKKNHKIIVSLGIVLVTVIFQVKKTLVFRRKHQLAIKLALEERMKIESKQTKLEIIRNFKNSEFIHPSVDIQFCVSHACLGQSHKYNHNLKQI